MLCGECGEECSLEQDFTVAFEAHQAECAAAHPDCPHAKLESGWVVLNGEPTYCQRCSSCGWVAEC